MSDTSPEQLARNAQIAQNNRDIRSVQRERHEQGHPVTRRDAAAIVAAARRESAKAEAARIKEIVAKAQHETKGQPQGEIRKDATIPAPKHTSDITDPHVIPRRERGGGGERITVLAVQITDTTFEAIQMDVRSEDYGAYP